MTLENNLYESSPVVRKTCDYIEPDNKLVRTKRELDAGVRDGEPLVFPVLEFSSSSEVETPVSNIKTTAKRRRNKFCDDR